MKTSLIIASLFIAQIATAQNLPFYEPPKFINTANSLFDNHPYADIIRQAEMTATPNAQKVLISARQMVENGEIIKGGCWDYLTTAWNRAGFGDKQRTIIFKGDIKTPPMPILMTFKQETGFIMSIMAITTSSIAECLSVGLIKITPLV